ncbi:MAG: TRAP transporter small permease [Deltaproteobacteria bacterium]|nr:TRAP transporter small permease [Deltaproteobacteria bacterium]MBM4324375.1 TRAP transporter small permease [Deltaproteobacteria bacterium]
MKKILEALRFLERVESSICIFFLLVMTCVVLLQVFTRYLLNYSFAWAEELVRYLMIWMVMIGAALVQSKNDHIRIDFLPMLAGPRGRRIMETLFRLCILVFVIILVIKGIKIAYFNRLFESPGLRISKLWPMIAIPLGGVLIGVYTTKALAQDFYRLLFWPAEKLQEEDRQLAMEKFQDHPVSDQGIDPTAKTG